MVKHLLKLENVMWAIVPFKGAPSAKSRLATHLDYDQRVLLAEAMLSDVLDALSAAKSLDGILVTSPTKQRFDWISIHAVELFEDKSPNLATALAQAIRHVTIEFRSNSIFVIPADIPLIKWSDVDFVVSQHRNVTIVPDSKRVGTNGLVCTPPDAINLVFDGESFVPHMEAARRVGWKPLELHIESFAHDIDRFEELELVSKVAPGSQTGKLITQHQLLEPSNLKPSVARAS